MRDVIITLLVFGSVPFILRSPMIGILVWSWLAYMNPHRLCWGFATSMPFAYVIALTTLLSLLLSKENKKIPWTRESILLVIFVIWMFITTVFALNPDDAWPQWVKVMKIQFVTFLTMMVMKDFRRINLLVATIAVSLGFYGVKGGAFTIVSGGGMHVWGPAGTFIGGNNEIGLALIMTIPLIRYLQMQANTAKVKYACIGAMALSVLAVLGTQSRGALVGVVAMIIFLVMKGKNRFAYMMLAIISGIVLYQFMPESWHNRMSSISSYDKDASALGRLNAWGFAFNLASSRLFGGGFETFSPSQFLVYAPNPKDFHDAHSIYFEIMGEQGLIGLAIFLALGVCTWFSAGRIAEQADTHPDMQGLANLLRMIQVSLVGYVVSGAFLGMGYFDLYYALVAIVVMSGYVLRQHVAEARAGVSPSPPPSALAPLTQRKPRDFVRKKQLVRD
ncbi:putative O-glycosylation ligase, exosortase A system-associated [Methylomagnum sp.]